MFLWYFWRHDCLCWFVRGGSEVSRKGTESEIYRQWGGQWSRRVSQDGLSVCVCARLCVTHVTVWLSGSLHNEQLINQLICGVMAPPGVQLLLSISVNNCSKTNINLGSPSGALPLTLCTLEHRKNKNVKLVNWSITRNREMWRNKSGTMNTVLPNNSSIVFKIFCK